MSLKELIETLKEYIGCDIVEFTKFCHEISPDITVRVVKRNGISDVVTQDMKLDRVNIALEHDIVTSVEYIG